MNLIETLVAKATEEACELGKAFSKLNFAGIKAVDPESGEPLVLDAIKQLNEILAAVELLRDRGVPLAGIGDPVAIGEAKNKIVQDMEEAMKSGTLTLTEDDQNPRPEGVNEAGAGLPEDGEGGGDGSGDEGEGLGDGGTGADGDDGAAGGDGDDLGGDGGEGDGDLGGDGSDTEGGDGEGEGDDQGEDAGDGSDGDSEGGDDGDGTDGEDDGNGDTEDDESEEEEEEEPGSNDV